MKKFWNWKNQDETQERVLELNGTIAEVSWFDDDITPKMFKDELYAGNGPITIWINSPGGDCIAASQIYSMLMDYKGDITVKIDGIAASAASVIAMAGTRVIMSPTALLMIHNPSTTSSGDHQVMTKAIELLEEVKESIINAYEIKTGMSRTVLSHMMDAETWMNAKKAVELGFADSILEDEKKNKPTDEAFMFQAQVFEKELINKISAKQTVSLPTEPKGRNISMLKNELNKIKNYI
ncbi:head maturation protease, ClpP-related [Mycoplasmopsis bovirhinis]|uniref:head maturation protease, ClpP-related n=1 Tax=Mycoplasmopsis bovirhinis TaxID=29553 RepID=UPI000E727A6D